MKQSQLLVLSLIFDYLAALAAWFLFYFYRVTQIENSPLVIKGTFITGMIVIPLCWMFLYTLQGRYQNLERSYRIKTIKQTFFGTMLGTILVFFALVLNDYVYSYTQFYAMILILFSVQFFITVIPRLIIITIHVKRIHKGQYGFKTIIIGGSSKAIDILDEIQKQKQSSGHLFEGFVNINGNDFALKEKLPLLGNLNDVDEIIRTHKIQEVIIAVESNDHEKLKRIITSLAGHNVRISLIPDAYDILSGQVQMNSIFGALLFRVNENVMPEWQISTKRILDIGISFLALILLLPLYLILAILVKSSSKGPVFFMQERIGLHQKPFQIIKFRTMYTDSEKSGPQLSSSNDKRITRIGKFLRKTRLDEFPQFLNVLKGEMSLVGPRPERRYYIDQIAQHDPQYLYLHQVRPGITSWGQVKFGYAENVEQMVERMKYDLLYIRNMSLALDIKIMFYTVAIIFKGKGK
ncbi:MAG: sugar transferase [Crocinitomicaceae bacterium]|jgi:exopolysaccharide biosynthesis polyprenyl glycosylphosphotransferase|nr:sugar transferase [Crocinitomicaceae bacterium]